MSDSSENEVGSSASSVDFIKIDKNDLPHQEHFQFDQYGEELNVDPMADEFDPYSPSPDSLPTEAQEVPQKAKLPQSPAELMTNPEPSSSGDKDSSQNADGGVAKTDDANCPFMSRFRNRINCLNPRVRDLILWTEPKRTAPVFAGSLLGLVVLRCYSLITVISYLGLAVLSATVSYRLFKTALAAVQKNDGDTNPFKPYLEKDITIPNDRVHAYVDRVIKRSTCALSALRRLFLVENIVDSLKLGLVLWLMCYVGSWFNGLSLAILFEVFVFTMPKIYLSNQALIDSKASILHNHINDLVAKAKTKIPPMPWTKKTKTQ